MTSPYTLTGPFVDGGPPYLSAATFNKFDAAAASTTAVAAPAPTGIAATDTTNLQNAITAALAAGQSLQLLSGTYALNAGLTWDLTVGNLTGMAGTLIDATAMTSGPAITIATASSSGSFAHQSIKYVLGHFGLNGPTVTSTTVDGIFIGDTTNGDDQGTIEHVATYGFRDALSYGSQQWCITGIKIFINNFQRYGIYMPTATNANENQTFLACVLAGGPTGTIGFRNTGNTDVSFFGCSFDYNDTAASIEAGTTRFFGCHIENRTPATSMVRVQQGVATTGRTVVGFHSCTFSATEAAPSTRAYVEVMSGSGAKLTLGFYGSVSGAYNTGQSLYVNNSTAAPMILHHGMTLDLAGTTAVPNYGAATNLVVNPGFDTSSPFLTGTPAYAGWYHQGSVTYTYSTAAPRTGSQNLRLVGTNAGAATSAWQTVPVRAATAYAASAWMSCPTWTSGSVTFRIQWYAADTTTSLGTVAVGQNFGVISATTTGYQPYAAHLMAPAGAAYANVSLYCSSDFAGTVDVDDVALWAI